MSDDESNSDTEEEVEVHTKTKKTSLIRGMVSKKKIRYQLDGYDLDLTYITPRVIAMGFPSVGTEAMYRNPMAQVQQFFETKHKNHYKIYNLCAEKEYDIEKFGGSVVRYPFADHNVSPLKMMADLVLDVVDFLGKSDQNVVALHCKAGKGRTGLMISCCLMWPGMGLEAPYATAAEALAHFGRMRTSNQKGVTIASQIRWVNYFERWIKHYSTQCTYRAPRSFNWQGVPLKLVSITMFGGPCNFDRQGGCDPWIKITNTAGATIYNQKKDKRHKKIIEWRKGPEFTIKPLDVELRGDFKVQFWDHDSLSSDDKMFGVWLHTSHISSPSLTLMRYELDGAAKDKKFKRYPKDFGVRLEFEGEFHPSDEPEGFKRPVPAPVFVQSDDSDEEEGGEYEFDDNTSVGTFASAGHSGLPPPPPSPPGSPPSAAVAAMAWATGSGIASVRTMKPASRRASVDVTGISSVRVPKMAPRRASVDVRTLPVTVRAVSMPAPPPFPSPLPAPPSAVAKLPPPPPSPVNNLPPPPLSPVNLPPPLTPGKALPPPPLSPINLPPPLTPLTHTHNVRVPPSVSPLSPSPSAAVNNNFVSPALSSSPIPLGDLPPPALSPMPSPMPPGARANMRRPSYTPTPPSKPFPGLKPLASVPEP